MAIQKLKYRIDPPDEIVRYIRHGYHAFIGCDDPPRCETFVKFLRDALSGDPVECINGSQALNRHDFAVLIVEACQQLVATLGSRFQPSLLGIAPSLEEAMLTFSAADRQGYLILRDIDPAIRMQRTIEFEGPLRSVMQCHDDVAVILIGSNDIINEMVGGYERPFYMSFHVFRL